MLRNLLITMGYYGPNVDDLLKFYPDPDQNYYFVQVGAEGDPTDEFWGTGSHKWVENVSRCPISKYNITRRLQPGLEKVKVKR